MISLKGLVANPGLFIGKTKTIKERLAEPQRKTITPAEIDGELSKFSSAQAQSLSEIEQSLETHDLGDDDRSIIEMHLMIVNDPDITAGIGQLIRDERLSAEYAVHTFFQNIIMRFERMENDFYAQRLADYKDVAQRLVSRITGEDPWGGLNISHDAIIIIPEMTPSHVTALARLGIKAYCSEKGSYNSHSSILSRALNLTALFNVQELSKYVPDGRTAILDGIDGRLIIDPDDETLQQYNQLIDKYQADFTHLDKIGNTPAETKNGIRIKLSANLELPQELDILLKNNPDGIGLFRSEFLYLSRNSLPTEKEQTEIYRKVLHAFADQTVTIRTFDLGGDKLTHLIPSSTDENPYLGCRGIRFSFEQVHLFKTQIRAILRASISGNARIMFPMVIDLHDFDRARQIVRQCMDELDREGIPFDRSIPLGVMIEIPSAALCADHLARHCDFFSIGTNDLVQYTLAVDRNNEKLDNYYVQHHPAVLNLIRMTVHSARTAGIPVSICGEMASISEYVPLLIGLGVTDLSVNPNRIPTIKSIISKCDAKLMDTIAAIPRFETVKQTEKLIYTTLKRYYE